MTDPNSPGLRHSGGGASWTSTTLLTVGLAALLAVGTAVGLVHAVNSSSSDRVAPSSTAPVYGAR